MQQTYERAHLEGGLPVEVPSIICMELLEVVGRIFDVWITDLVEAVLDLRNVIAGSHLPPRYAVLFRRSASGLPFPIPKWNTLMQKGA